MYTLDSPKALDDAGYRLGVEAAQVLWADKQLLDTANNWKLFRLFIFDVAEIEFYAFKGTQLLDEIHSSADNIAYVAAQLFWTQLA